MRSIQFIFRLGFLFACYFNSGWFIGGNPIFAQTTAGNAVYQFLKLPYSAKATSLGGLNISSIGNDLGLAMTQPALLSTNLDGELQVSVKPYFAGIQQYDLNGANKLKSDWVIGWGVHYMDYGSIAQTDVLGNEYGSINPNEYAIQVGIAKTYLEYFNFGTQIKFIQSNYGSYTSNGIAMDVGVRYLSNNSLSQWSILLQNVGTQLKYFQEKEELPFINPTDLEEEMVDPELLRIGYGHTIGSFSFQDQNSKTISDADVKGKVFVAEYFFTTCQTICPVMNTQMQRVQKSLKGVDDFKILSFTVDPDTDTVEQMKRYAIGHKADDVQWKFLTGKKEDLYALARKSFFVLKPAEAENQGDVGSDFIHTNNFVLVDQQMRIRGYYDGTSTKEVDQLIHDIHILLGKEHED